MMNLMKSKVENSDQLVIEKEEIISIRDARILQQNLEITILLHKVHTQATERDNLEAVLRKFKSLNADQENQLTRTKEK